mmetsp:Transcript_4349/g.12739  ORF Transcript_4349/g.12739 Transcript_4349/m.12739 type:complete len:91 (+) Transcript_4349:697-969(+)
MPPSSSGVACPARREGLCVLEGGVGSIERGSVLVFYLWALLLNVAWALTGNFDTYYGEGQGTRHEARPMGQLGRMGNQHSRRSRSCHGFV